MLYYAGAWRMPWHDIDLELYGGTLPNNLRELYRTNVTDLQGSGFSLCKDLGLAIKFLEYCNRETFRCELIAVYSPRLAELKGTIDVADDLLRHLGWDPIQIGGGPLLVDNGIFTVPDLFPTWRERLNENGLLASAEEALQYVSNYLQLVEAKLIEEIYPTDSNPIEPIRVFSVRTD